MVKLLKYLWRTKINYLIFTGQIYPGQSPKSSIVAHRIHNLPKSASCFLSCWKCLRPLGGTVIKFKGGEKIV